MSISNWSAPRFPATAGSAVPRSASAWRHAPQSTVTVQVTVDPAGVGWTGLSQVAADSVRTIQALQSKLRQLSEEGCGLNERWSEVRTARVRAGRVSALRESPLSVRDWCIASTIVKERPDDD